MSYSEIETNRLVGYYKDGMTITALADRFMKSEHSIIAKLSAEHVYRPPEKVSKVTGDSPLTKLGYVQRICQALDTDNLFDLEKAPKNTLAKLLGLIE